MPNLDVNVLNAIYNYIDLKFEALEYLYNPEYPEMSKKQLTYNKTTQNCIKIIAALLHYYLIDSDPDNLSFNETSYTINELAEMINMSKDYIRNHLLYLEDKYVVHSCVEEDGKTKRYFMPFVKQ